MSSKCHAGCCRSHRTPDRSGNIFWVDTVRRLRTRGPIGPGTFFRLAAFERRVERSPDISRTFFKLTECRPRTNALHLRCAIATLTVSRRACGTHKTVTSVFLDTNPADFLEPTSGLWWCEGDFATVILRYQRRPLGFGAQLPGLTGWGGGCVLVRDKIRSQPAFLRAICDHEATCAPSLQHFA
jgi:hypothetical protein